MMFDTQYSDRPRVAANPGSRIRPLFSPEVDKQGRLELVQTGQENLYEYIQSHAQSVDINYIMAMYQRGDVDALERVQGLYTDVTGLPKTYAEMLNTIIKGEDAFMDLPLEVRQKFNHSFYEWMASMDDWQSFAQKMGFQLPTVDNVAGAQEKAAIKAAVSPEPVAPSVSPPSPSEPKSTS